ncbi:putative holin-like toxin [Proteiniborus sp. MB09-C3]|nr:putative holin-like toxin [Proteiniborus sp. MB09-C3]WIV12214.1 putative holin-like toxin [Proteiniborus sp. MB09-C3]
MSTYQAISLMIAFGVLLISLISYLDRDKSRKK